MSVVRIEFKTFDLIGISAQRVRSTDDESAGVFAFEILGPSLATFVVPRGQTPQLVDQVDIGRDVADPSRPMWGAATAYEAPWVYVYGTGRPRDAATGTLRYLPLAHPELLPQPGTVVVSYSQNNTDFEAVEDDPRIYRPRFLRVSLQPK